MARTKKQAKRPQVIRSISLSEDTENILHQLGQDASDRIGRAISGGAVLRALLRWADAHEGSWIEQVIPTIEEELTSGILWGKRAKAKRTPDRGV